LIVKGSGIAGEEAEIIEKKAASFNPTVLT